MLSKNDKYFQMMQSLWDINALVAEVQTSKIISEQIIKCKESFAASLLEPHFNGELLQYSASNLDGYLAELEDYQSKMQEVIELIYEIRVKFNER